MASIMGKRMRGALGKLSDEEIRDVLKMDLSVSTYIQQQQRKFMLFCSGNRRNTRSEEIPLRGCSFCCTFTFDLSLLLISFQIDCSVFGHVASTYFLPYRQTLSDVLDDDLPSIKGLINRIRTHYYPEWKESKQM